MSESIKLGTRFGRWTVIEKEDVLARKHRGVITYICKCDCGTVRPVRKNELLNGRTQGCSKCRYSSKRAEPLKIGSVHGHWTIVSLHRDWKNKAGKYCRSYDCLCSCGANDVVREETLLGDTFRGCLACFHAENITTHGHTARGVRSITYVVWDSMRERTKPTSTAWHAKQGVRMCDRWRNSLTAFIDDMGERPSKKFTIERMNKDTSTKHYSCGKCAQCKRNGWVFHCRWATQAEQMNNRSDHRHITYQGETLNAMQWSRKLGINYQTIIKRLNRGLEPERVLATRDLRQEP